MDTGVFELPNAICTDSGQWVREVELAEMTGEEEDILADQTRMVGKGKLAKRADQRMTEILSRCTVRLGDWRYPHSFQKPQQYDHMYYRYEPSMRIPVYNKSWYNFYPTEKPYHSGHHFILDVF